MSGSAKSAGGDITSGAKSAVGDAKGAAQGAGRQIDQATPDLSGVFDDIVGKVGPSYPVHGASALGRRTSLITVIDLLYSVVILRCVRYI